MSFSHTVTARAEHIDELGHVNNTVWVQWIQDIATAHVVYEHAKENDNGYPFDLVDTTVQ